MPYDNLRKKTFILGVGAQKAGTSWLYEYLKSSPEITMSPLKEVHYFDTKFSPDMCLVFNRIFLRRLQERAGELLSQNTTGEDDPLFQALLDRVAMSARDRAYLDHFSRIIDSKASHFGEITPTYALLGEDGYREIKKMAQDNDLNLKVIFLLRDPVGRHLSNLRNQAKKHKKFNARKEFNASLELESYTLRSSYDQTMTSLLNVFDAKDVHFEFYENLFNGASIRRICDFLGVEYREAEFDRKVNPSTSAKIQFTDDEIVKLYKKYEHIYEFCGSYFGDLLPDSWLKSSDISKLSSSTPRFWEKFTSR